MPKTTIILIHGLRGDHHGLAFIAKNLEELGFNVLLPDLPGSGDNAELDNKTLSGYADWLHAYIREQNLEQRPVILGHSMGSIIASYFCEKYPHDCSRKVVFLSPIFRKESEQLLSDIEYGALVGMLYVFPSKSRYKIMKSRPISYVISHVLTSDKTQQEYIDDLHYKYSGRFSSADSLLADCKISMREQTTIPKDKQILFCIGAKDKLTDPELVRERAKESHNEARIVPNTGHLINYERPQVVAEIVKDFLQG